ncbi:hypothetical protein AB0O22_07890 [Streptomyces sp. NPDC091204]|uniref:hypothetical protein n=1 Tax=Streptomyces sp. NPDC091204 TaxID=3155299 RepID=UPI00343CAF4B
MSAALFALAVTLALALGGSLAYSVRIEGRLDRGLRHLGRTPCPTTCTTCSTTPRRAENGETTP